MNYYNEKILPQLIQRACSSKPASKQREKVIPYAEGVVLEIGAGSGLNFAYYDTSKVQKIWALEPSLGMQAIAKKTPVSKMLDVEYLSLLAEDIPFKKNTIDTIVCTYVLCTIPNVELALKKMYEVLKPEGKLLFTEHGLAPDKKIKVLQNLVNPIWKRVSGGCNLNRNISMLLKGAGFYTVEEQMYIPGFRFYSYNYWGKAVKSSI
ncbi:MAG: SAM-dependent methyltransferase [Woeseiaceae bacterium]|jgi:ubiquinone/menaquinone biosynthesis C-methylase UbiE|nr:SAM-dependent methyltransferase [Woeseiaceae bacterium]|tara:strand:- start:4983 stop:5603 length:621 start_codon:yes stop_codon:yes gene_type:complete